MENQKKLGLALGGGAGRGFAHLGVLQVLEEHNISIHAIAGTSMGAVVGAVYAAGTDLNMIVKLIPLLCEKDYFDVVLPRNGGFLRGERFQDLIRLLTKGYDFSQTRISFVCTGVDLIEGELVILDEGPLDGAIRASIAMPGVFEPVRRGDRLLVDGGIISRVPARQARDLGVDVVIGVDVGYRGGKSQIKLTGMLECLMAASDILGWEAAKERESEADIMLLPDVRDCDPYSFKDFGRSVEAGRQAAVDALPQIRSLLGRKSGRQTAVAQKKSEKVTLKKSASAKKQSETTRPKTNKKTRQSAAKPSVASQADAAFTNAALKSTAAKKADSAASKQAEK